MRSLRIPIMFVMLLAVGLSAAHATAVYPGILLGVPELDAWATQTDGSMIIMDGMLGTEMPTGDTEMAPIGSTQYATPIECGDDTGEVQPSDS